MIFTGWDNIVGFGVESINLLSFISDFIKITIKISMSDNILV